MIVTMKVTISDFCLLHYDWICVDKTTGGGFMSFWGFLPHSQID